MLHFHQTPSSKVRRKFRYSPTLSTVKIPAPKAAQALSVPPTNTLICFLKPNFCCNSGRKEPTSSVGSTKGGNISSGISKCCSNSLDYFFCLISTSKVPIASEISNANFPVTHQRKYRLGYLGMTTQLPFENKLRVKVSNQLYEKT